jgi:PEGA domain-containing protein
MSRVIAVAACGFALAACSMSMPSLNFLGSGPTTEVLRVESEPPGADARTSQGQSCRTPCELTVTSGGDMSISYALNGYQPLTLQVRPESSPQSGFGESAARLQPNPVYAELQPMRPPAKKKQGVKRKQTAQKTTPGPGAPAPAQGQGASDPNTAYPSGYPWPDPQPR